MSQQFNSYNESGGWKKIKIAERGFDPRTSGLWAQHAHCLLRLVRVLRFPCELSAKVGMIGPQDTFEVK